MPKYSCRTRSISAHRSIWWSAEIFLQDTIHFGGGDPLHIQFRIIAGGRLQKFPFRIGEGIVRAGDAAVEKLEQVDLPCIFVEAGQRTGIPVRLGAVHLRVQQCVKIGGCTKFRGKGGFDLPGQVQAAAEYDRVFHFRVALAKPGNGGCHDMIHTLTTGDLGSIFLLIGIPGILGEQFLQFGIRPPDAGCNAAGLQITVAKLFRQDAADCVCRFCVCKPHRHFCQTPFVVIVILLKVEADTGGIAAEGGGGQVDAPHSGEGAVLRDVQRLQKLVLAHAPPGAGVDQQTVRGEAVGFGHHPLLLIPDQCQMGFDAVIARIVIHQEQRLVGRIEDGAAVVDEAVDAVEHSGAEIAGKVIVAVGFLQIIDGFPVQDLLVGEVRVPAGRRVDVPGGIAVDGDGHILKRFLLRKGKFFAVFLPQELELLLSGFGGDGEIAQELRKIQLRHILIVAGEEGRHGGHEHLVLFFIVDGAGKSFVGLADLLLGQSAGIFVGQIFHGLIDGQGIGQIGLVQRVGLGRLVGLRRCRGPWGTGKGAAHGQRHQQDHGGEGQNRVPGALHQQPDPLPEGSGGAGHGGGGEEKVADGIRAGQTDEGAAIVAPLIFAQLFQCALVTGQLRIGTADLGGDPDQGIIPVEHQAYTPQHRPDVV